MAEDCAEVDLTARRFMGVLKRPVPRSEMLHECAVDRHGSKVVVEWPQDSERCPIQSGDILEVAGSSYSICNVKPHGCYLELYLNEA
jgi:hypothetical protein